MDLLPGASTSVSTTLPSGPRGIDGDDEPAPAFGQQLDRLVTQRRGAVEQARAVGRHPNWCYQDKKYRISVGVEDWDAAGSESGYAGPALSLSPRRRMRAHQEVGPPGAAVVFGNVPSFRIAAC